MSKKSKPVIISLKFICPSAKVAKRFAKEVQDEFTEVSDVIPQMTGWTIEAVDVIENVPASDSDPATDIPYGD